MTKESLVRTTLLAAAIAAGLFMPCAAALAQTAPGDSAQLDDLKAQLAQLQAQVAQLEQHQATAAAAPSSDASKRLDALEKLVNDTKISGVSFIDFTNIDQANRGAKTAASGDGLDVKRFYLSVDHRFNDIWSANLTTDFNYTAVTGQTQLFVKKAYLQGALSPLATLRVGSANMPWIPMAEDWYGYRFVENTLVDRMKVGNSADWGAHLLGDNGTLNYQVSVVNGGGYKNPTRTDHVDFEARVGIQPIKGLLVAVGGYDGELGKDTATTPALHTTRRYDALAAWNRDGLRLGAEWFRATNWQNVATAATDAATGWSLWGSYDFGRFAAFGRYDRSKPSTTLDPTRTDRYWNTGLAMPFGKGLRVALAYKDDHLANATTLDMHTREVGLWGEVKW